MIKLPTTPYKWQEWDCFALAGWLRSQANLKPLPNLNWLYRHYTEDTLPPNIVSRILRHYATKESELTDMNLVCLQFGKHPEALGTIVDSGVVFITYERGAAWMSLAHIQKIITGTWKY